MSRVAQLPSQLAYPLHVATCLLLAEHLVRSVLVADHGLIYTPRRWCNRSRKPLLLTRPPPLPLP